MRQVVGIGDRLMGREGAILFGGECGAPHCNQWGLRGLVVKSP